MHGVWITGTGGEVITDTGGITQIDVLHHLVHEGKLHDVPLYKGPVATSAVANIAFTVAAEAEGNTAYQSTIAGIHSRINYNVSSGGIKVEIGTVASYTGGTAITPVNQNTYYGNLMASTFADTATLTTFTAFKTFEIGGISTNQNRTNAFTLDALERLFKAGGKYAFQFTPLVNDTRYAIDFLVYERYLVAL